MAKIETYKDRTKKSFLVVKAGSTTLKGMLIDEAHKRFPKKKIELAVGWVYKDALYFDKPHEKAKPVLVAYSLKEAK